MDVRTHDVTLYLCPFLQTRLVDDKELLGLEKKGGIKNNKLLCPRRRRDRREKEDRQGLQVLSSARDLQLTEPRRVILS